jgi:hypothetical protein
VACFLRCDDAGAEIHGDAAAVLGRRGRDLIIERWNILNVTESVTSVYIWIVRTADRINGRSTRVVCSLLYGWKERSLCLFGTSGYISLVIDRSCATYLR